MQAGRDRDAFDQQIGLGDGSKTRFSLIKIYGIGADAYRRDILKPVAATVRVAVNNSERAPTTGFTIDPATGEVVFPAGRNSGGECCRHGRLRIRCAGAVQYGAPGSQPDRVQGRANPLHTADRGAAMSNYPEALDRAPCRQHHDALSLLAADAAEMASSQASPIMIGRSSSTARRSSRSSGSAPARRATGSAWPPIRSISRAHFRRSASGRRTLRRAGTMGRRWRRYSSTGWEPSQFALLRTATIGKITRSDQRFISRTGKPDAGARPAAGALHAPNLRCRARRPTLRVS